ncbi:MAG: AbgT family transporter [Gemmataceae bacterium]
MSSDNPTPENQPTPEGSQSEESRIQEPGASGANPLNLPEQPHETHFTEQRQALGGVALGPPNKTIIGRFLDFIEWAGNKLPDPAMLFFGALIVTWVASFFLSFVTFTDIDPRTLVAKKNVPAAKNVAEANVKAKRAEAKKDEEGKAEQGQAEKGQEKPQGKPIEIKNQLAPAALAAFLSDMVTTFTGFHPLGVVLVALLGVGVAEHTGFINAVIKWLLNLTPKAFITPMLLVVAIVSHTAGDTGYVLVIPLGGVIFATAGRHPVAGIVCAFAGVSGGFSANFIVSGLDPLLQGLTQAAAELLDPNYKVGVLCNYLFMTASSGLIVAVGWYVTDRIVEPRLKSVPVDGDGSDMPKLEALKPSEEQGMIIALATMGVLALGLIAACIPANSLFRDPNTGALSTFSAPLMKSIVPLIFFFFIIPGIVYGYAAGTVKSHRDIVAGMSKSMSSMGYYLVLAFFAAQFIYVFGKSNIGALIAIKGASFLQFLGLPPQVTIVGIIFLAALVNLLVGSASAKWALLAPIFVPMLMQLNLPPELTQAAYRVGDSSTNIITPLMPYFPLIVTYAQRYVKNTGIGTMISLMIPYSVAFLIVWTALLLVFWQVGLPLGIPMSVGYEYTASQAN